ncbi:MAG TPA: GntR family transcriptional regulator [Ruminococcaceae bacterium]|nr:GntR family transcriptional regulator [Oscillospiraceae bacterium]
MFKIELDGTASIHDQICSEISRLISVGVLAPDEKLPAVRETAKALGVNPNTVQKAYAALEKNGLIYSVPAKGSYVAPGGIAAEAVKKEASEALRTAMEKAALTGVSRETAEEIMNDIWGKKG